ncbi:helix-turn-helix domain-containing protein [Paenibacillus urinalis]|uniref:helix-turn-helix domain-containing protein n=1 Tax=Paenibacillus urinalis TaxID=521520 RepID=UPI00195F8BA7
MLTVDSISELHDLLGYDKPKHPLITAMSFDKAEPSKSFMNTEVMLNFYVISLKSGTQCDFKYGRQYYDFREGSLVFTAPGQIMTSEGEYTHENSDGWMLCVHPDMIRGSSLWSKMSEYSFFEYEASEALHLSEQERQTIEQIVRNIKDEYSKNIDLYTKELVVSNLELLLNYAKRFYGRQFITRESVYKDVVTKFEKLLNEHCTLEVIARSGTPSVKSLAQEMGYSPNYLSDMLKKETGKTAQEYIKSRLLDLAEHLLLTTNEPISQIAEKLGFEQPSSFTKFIKTQLGVSPMDFRKQHLV